MGRLEGKCAVVTGGASGIGHAIATAFAQEGARVFVADLSPERCEAAARAIGAAASPVMLDVRDQQSIDAMVAAVEVAAGGIDILVQSAGLFDNTPIDEVTREGFDRIVDVNLKGSFFTLAAVGRAMVRAGKGGAIINISSGAARRGVPGVSVYSLTKAALVSLTQSAAQEYIGHGIRVNAIAPGSTLTPMFDQVRDAFARQGVDADSAQAAVTPAGRLAVPADYAGAALFLATPESAFVVGQTINVDGGMFMN